MATLIAFTACVFSVVLLGAILFVIDQERRES